MSENNSLAVSGAYVRLRTLADGTPRVEIDLDCTIESAAQLFTEPGVMVALARLHHNKIQKAEADLHQFGQQAKALKLSGFFRAPEVWRAVGTDEEFLAWVSKQSCCASTNGFCNGDVVAAHVRRIADGAGTGIKPEYAAIPLCHLHHSRQHEQGESALGGKEWMDHQRLIHVERWAWDTLKEKLGYASMGDISPAIISQWAADHQVYHYLPMVYRE